MRKIRPESRRWIAPPVLGSPFRLPIDPLQEVVPFVPLPDPTSAWAILCPSGCRTELIILPEYAGQWVECPTCGFRFLGPHSAQLAMVAEARARAARVAADEEKVAGVLAALAKVEPGTAPSPVGKPDEPNAAELQVDLFAEPPPPAKPEELPLAELVPEQLQVMDVLAMLAEASQESAMPRRIVFSAEPVPKPRAQRETKAANVLEKLEKNAHRPAGPPQRVVPEPPRHAPPPVAPVPGDLTPEETIAVDALEALAEATIPARKAQGPAAAVKPDAAAKPAAAKKPPSRVAQRLALGAPPRRKKIQATNRPAQMAAHAVPPAPVRARRGDLMLTWVVSMAIAAAIVATAFGCGLPDLAIGAVPFVGLAVIRTWKALHRHRDDGLPY